MQRSSEAPWNADTLVRDELVGLTVRVAVTGDPTLAGLEGTVVRETMGTLTVRSADRRRVVAKVGQTFAFNVHDRPVLVDGSAIAYRPEDRIKKARVKR